MNNDKIPVLITGHTTSSKQKECGAYILKHKESGKIYCGSSKDLHRRLNEHRKTLSNAEYTNKGLQTCVLEDPKLILEFYPTTTVEEARLKEKQLIEQTDSELVLNISTNTTNPLSGWNKNPIMKKALSFSKLGNKNALGTIHTNEHKQKISERLIGNKHRLGILHDDEARKKMSEAQKGRKCSPEHTAASAEGRTTHRVEINGVVYQNAAKAAIEIGISYAGIKKRCVSLNFPEYQLIPK